ncbi:MAG: pantoate--beta-alanine ligase [Oligosphaeraceae bacterium]|nr:pantoate--beta-alanine ligase [Oligosphaeraceae bacterium]
MKILRSIEAIESQRSEWQSRNLRIALVPTMGYLHAGHLSLVKIAKAQSDRVVVSIFVNPTQFGPNEDLDRYPRDFDRDERLCAEAGVDAVFYPPATDMYAPNHSTWVQEDSLSQTLCGASRPGHFRGVTTVVLKLFNLSGCRTAVFGRKDAQQALIIRRMVRDLNVPVEVVFAPLIREPDGLALSSRNKFLSPAEHQSALSISRGIFQAEERYRAGVREAEPLLAVVRESISAAGGKIDYVSLMEQETLRPLAVADRPALLAVAAFFGQTRLIDNVFLE